MKWNIVMECAYCPEWHNKQFGPFTTAPAAVSTLREKGWINQNTGKKGLWYAQISRFTGINARVKRIKSENTITSLRDPLGIPKMRCFLG